MKLPIVIAIDGVSGAGKSTLARALARRLGFLYLDTGAMYRALTYKALQDGLDFSDPGKLARGVQNCKIHLNATGRRLWLDGQEITRQIRGVAVSRSVSLLASVPRIRHCMVRLQRSMAKNHSIVMEGRDIGTVVFPKAQIKLFLTASLEERAKRRWAEMHAMGNKVKLQTILENLATRDKKDSSRKASPLRQAKDALVVDSTSMSARQKTATVLKLIADKLR